ncbi:MAG TPA: hypothetical protein VK831_02975 [Candidatus Deferrimicrobiaceae bacterium]|nr:hypothetical protein [Candidatus Deferrimicrobiaceae bacterium]
MTRARTLAELGLDPVRLSLVVSALLLLQPTKPTAAALVVGIAVVGALIASTRWDLSRLVLAGLLVAGLVLRLDITERVGSDVLKVTTAAIEHVLRGGNPYGVGYSGSNPPGAPFPYGPLALLWYLPVLDAPRYAELLASTLVATILALQGRLVGLTVYALAPVLVSTAVDGSNDTTLGLLLLTAFAAAARRPVLGAAALAAAAAFKLSALAWVPAFVVWAGWQAAGAFAATLSAAWLPVLVAWGPGNVAWSIQTANAMHGEVTWSLGWIVREISGSSPPPWLNTFKFALGAGATVLTAPFVRSLDAVILTGALVYLVTLFGGTWATYAYFAALAPLVCWRLDDWLGLPRRPLVSGRPPSEAGLVPND